MVPAKARQGYVLGRVAATRKGAADLFILRKKTCQHSSTRGDAAAVFGSLAARRPEFNRKAIRSDVEDGGADADDCGAFLDGDFVILGHAHGEVGQVAESAIVQPVSQFP